MSKTDEYGRYYEPEYPDPENERPKKEDKTVTIKYSYLKHLMRTAARSEKAAAYLKNRENGYQAHHFCRSEDGDALDREAVCSYVMEKTWRDCANEALAILKPEDEK